MKCPNCQKEIPKSSNVCGYCGHRIKNLVPSLAPASPSLKGTSPHIGIIRWILPAGLLIVLVIGGLLFMNGSNRSAGSVPDRISSPVSIVIRSTVTSNPIATNTEIPTPRSFTRSFDISNFLKDLKIIESDDFSKQTDLWNTTGSGVQWKNNFVQLIGQPVFVTHFFCTRTLQTGQAALFLFEYPASDLNVNFLLENGEWNTTEYKRHGINIQAQAVADIYDGKQNFWGELLQGDMRLVGGKTYYVLLALDVDRSFYAVVADANNISSYNIFRQEPTPDWPLKDWIIAIQADSGQINIDQYYLLSLE